MFAPEKLGSRNQREIDRHSKYAEFTRNVINQVFGSETDNTLKHTITSVAETQYMPA